MRSKKIAVVYLFVFFCTVTLAKLGLIANNFDVINDGLSFAEPSLSYWLGNDFFGRSVLSRSLHGGFNAMSVGLLTALISLFVGTTLGLVAGYCGGWWDSIIKIIFSVLESIPYFFLLAAVGFVVGQGFFNVVLALGLTSWVVLCRAVRTECQKIKSSDYVLAARALGLSDFAIVLRHVLPNLKTILSAQVIIIFVLAIKLEVLLTFIGLGVEPGTPSWGYMLDDSRQELANGFWWGFVTVTVMMASVVLSLNTMLKEPVDSH